MNPNVRSSLRAILAATAGGSLYCALAPVAGAASPAPRAAETSGLEEVIVTARKREETLQNVPVAVTAFSTEQIERYNLASLENIAGSAPELFVARTSNGAGAQITMRGIGSQATSIAIEQSTSVVVDGVYYGSGFFLNEALFDLKGLEILKGPQALFFGKNATAGVISVTTAKPTESFEALTRIGYDFKAQDVQGQAIISGPISSTLRGRLAVRASSMGDGYFRNAAVGTPITFLDLATFGAQPRFQQPNGGGAPGTSEQAARGTLAWEPTDRFTATLIGSWSNRADESNAWNYVPVACGNGTGFTQVNAAVRCAKDFNVYIPNAPDGVAGSLPDMKPDGSSYLSYRSYAATLDLGYRLDSATITSITNYNWNRVRWGLGQNVQSPTSSIAATQNSEFSAFSNESRLQGTLTGPFNYLVGAYYQKTHRNHTQAAAFAPLEDSSLPADRRFVSYIKPGRTDNETVSGFGQVTWRFVPTVELSAGVRYIHEQSSGYVEQSYVQSALRGLFPEGQRISADQTFRKWTPEATLAWYPNENITVYGGYKSAYKSGGFSVSALVVAATTPGDLAFEPETASGFDGGVKMKLFDNQMRLNFNLYHTRYKNLQVDFFNSQTFQFITTNAGTATVRGIEAEAQFAPKAVAGLRLNATANFNRARYTDYVAPCYTGQSIAAGCNTTFSGGPGQDLAGKPLAMAPNWTGSAGGVYSFGLGDSLLAELGATLRFSGSYFASSFGAPLSKQDSFVNLDASMALRSADERWELALIGRNLTNSFHISSQLDLPNSGSGTGTANAVPADQIGIADLPRRVMLQYTQRF